MKNISPLSDDPLRVYDEIVGVKKPLARRARLQALRSHVEGAYAEYDRLKPALEQLQPLVLHTEQAKDLRHCYGGSTLKDKPSGPRDRLYARIRALAHGKCPYCTVNSVETLDHYLPKEHYPEFSILTLNLVPSCTRCNRPRPFKTQRGERSLVHPYFDAIPDERILVAKVTVALGVPHVMFEVDLSQCSDHAFAALYRRHVDLLDLCRRYQEEASLNDAGLAVIGARVTSLGSLGLHRQDVAAALFEEANLHERRSGANHFLTVLTRGAASSEEFLDLYLAGAR